MNTEQIINKINTEIKMARYRKKENVNHPDSVSTLNKMLDDVDDLIQNLRDSSYQLELSKAEIKAYLAESQTFSNYS